MHKRETNIAEQFSESEKEKCMIGIGLISGFPFFPQALKLRYRVIICWPPPSVIECDNFDTPLPLNWSQDIWTAPYVSGQQIDLEEIWYKRANELFHFTERYKLNCLQLGIDRYFLTDTNTDF